MDLCRKRSAFTLIEVMIVVVIIAVLALMAGPRIIKLMGGLKESTTKATISALKGGIERYHQDMGTVPRTLDDLLENPGGRKEKESTAEKTRHPPRGCRRQRLRQPGHQRPAAGEILRKG